LRPVFLTGVGLLSAAGLGREAFRSTLAKREVPSQVVQALGPRGRSRYLRVARVPSFDARVYLSPGRIRRMTGGSIAPVVAAILADRDARERGFEASVPPDRRSIVLGTGLGPIETTEKILSLLSREGPSGAEPFLFIESLHNAPAGHAAIVLGCRGPALTPVVGDASGLAAVILGARLIQESRADCVYAGGFEEISPFFVQLMARIGPRRQEIPLMGAGAAFFRLESERGGDAKPYAMIAATALAHDPSAPGLDYGTDPGVVARLLERTLGEAGWGREEVDLLITAENGFPGLSSLERRIYSDWPGSPPAGGCRVESPARVFGAFAGSGGFGLAAAAEALDGGRSARRALVCLPSWGGGCQALALSAAGS